MKVTGIEEVSKKRTRVYLDGTFAFVLYKGELRKYQIREGMELEEEAIWELQTKVLTKRAKLRAMNLLKNRQYTEKQLMDKLQLGGYSQEIAQEAVEYVKSYHYVDDARYAYDYVACQAERRSRKEIEQKLMQRGIRRELIGSAIEALEADGFVPDEAAMIRRLLEKKQFTWQEADDKGKRRIYAYFYRKGFSPELVRQVMEDSYDYYGDNEPGN